MIQKAIITIFILQITFLNANNIALCIKAKGKILRQGNVRDGYIRKGDPIYVGDKIIMDGEGYMSFKFIGDDVVVNVFDNTVIKVFGFNKNANSKTNIALFGGKVIIQMQESSNKKFILDVPSTKIIAVGGYFISEYKNDILFDNLSYSIVTGLKGEIEILNTASGSSIYLRKGETIVSTLGGEFFQLETFNNQTLIENTLREK